MGKPWTEGDLLHPHNQPDEQPRCLRRCRRRGPRIRQPQHLPPVPKRPWPWLARRRVRPAQVHPAPVDGRNAHRERRPVVARRQGGALLRKHLLQHRTRRGGNPSQPRAADRGTVRRRPRPPQQSGRRRGTINFNALGHFSGDRSGLDRLWQEIDSAATSGGWIIYMMQGVGEGPHSRFIDPGGHQDLVDFLGERRDSIWTAPVGTVARYLRDSA